MGINSLLGILSGLGDLLNSLFSGLFNVLVKTLIVPVVESAIRIVVTVVQYFTATFFYEISCFLLQLIDFVEVLFRALSGLDNTSSSGIQLSLGNGEGDLLIQLLRSEEILQAFYAVCIVGIFLLIITTIFQMIRVEYTTEGAQNSKSGIIGKSLKSLANLMLIPLLVIFGVIIGNGVLDLIDTATGGGDGTKISGTLFITAASTAMLSDETQESDWIDIDNSGGLLGAGVEFAITKGFAAFLGDPSPVVEMGDPSNRDTIESAFMKCESGYLYHDPVSVVKYYNPFEINYLVLIFGACIIIKCLYHCCFGMVDRLYTCVALFIVSPMVIGMSPVKDSLGSWRSKFISKALSAYGVVISLNLFFIIVKVLLNVDIRFNMDTENWLFTETFMSGLIKAILVIVGCLMIEKLSGDLGGYFGGGDAAKDGAGLAKEATSGLAKAAVVGGGIALGGGALMLKGAGLAGKLAGGAVKQTSGLIGGVGSKLKGGTFSAGRQKGLKVGSAIASPIKTTGKGIKKGVGIIADKAKDTPLVKKAQKGIKRVNDFRAGIWNSERDMQDAKQKGAELRRLRKAQASGTQGVTDDTIAKAQKEYDDARAKVQQNIDKRQARKDQDLAVKDKVKGGLLKAGERATLYKEGAMKMVKDHFGVGALFKAVAPKSISGLPNEFKNAVKDANSVSEEGKTLLANYENAKSGKAEAAYDRRNKGIISKRNAQQTGIAMTAAVAFMNNEQSNANKKLGLMDQEYEKLKQIIKDANKSDEERDIAKQQALGMQQQMQAINPNIKFEGLERIGDLNINYDTGDFKQKMEEALKRHASKKEIEEIFEEQMKEWGQKGNAEILKKLHEELEKLKEKLGK